ncbi:MAG: hypothetical protein C0519_01365 [Hyphomicrobium sp.]|nr:hypothetical protein [Hyphomicrobium sp.]PPD09554.1 MAG: hypothetical protein CTY28_01740 [Hyphomicrobium sp.]
MKSLALKTARSGDEAGLKGGFKVTPLLPGTKKPFLRDWQKAPFDALDVLEIWDYGDQHGVGIVTGDGFFVLDVDVKNGQPGAESLARMIAVHGPLPATRTVRTPSGGWHYYFATPPGRTVSNANKGLQTRFGEGLDIRGVGGQVVAPGNIYDGKPYAFEREGRIAPAPEWLLDCLAPAPVKSEDAAKVVCETDRPEDLARCRMWLENSPDVFEGGRDDAAYKMACRFLNLGASPESCRELLETWSEKKCRPSLTDDDLDRVAGSATRNLQDAIGRDSFQAAAATFGEIEQPPDSAPVPARSLIEYPDEISVDAILKAQAQSIVKGLIAPGDVGIMYGESTAGKSFALVDIGFHVALGRTWAGLRVKQSAVLYICLEGAPGFRKRVATARDNIGNPGKFFARITVPVFLSAKSPDETKKSIDHVLAAHSELMGASGAQQSLIIIDTLSRVMAGDDENKVEDVMNFLTRYVGEIQRATGAAVAIAHHTNKLGDIRGSTAIKASVDFVIHARKSNVVEDNKKPAANNADPSDVRTLFAEKVKDGEEKTILKYRLKQIPLGTDPDGDLASSCIIEPVTETADARAKECFDATGQLMAKAFATSVRLSPRKNASKDPNGVERYAPKWLVKNYRGEADFTVEEFETALAGHINFSITIEDQPDSKGELRPVYVPFKVPSGGFPAVPDPGGSGGSAAVDDETTGDQ